jgi:hypothetical protein
VATIALQIAALSPIDGSLISSQIQNVSISNHTGQFTLTANAPASLRCTPAGRTLYAAAGQGTLVIEFKDNL